MRPRKQPGRPVLVSDPGATEVRYYIPVVWTLVSAEPVPYI